MQHQLVIHATDDSLAVYENAEALARRIPDAELFSIARGGHLLWSQEETVRAEVARFLQTLNETDLNRQSESIPAQ